MEVIVSKRCSCCTRMLPIERFRLRTRYGRTAPIAQCDQCEKGREAARWQRTKERMAREPAQQRTDCASQHQRCNTQFDNWRGPVSPGLVGGRIAA